MAEIDRIKDQLRRSLEGEAWHGPSLQEVLAGVTAEMAAARPVIAAHSIWEIVLHITAWERAAQRGLLGESVDLTDEEDWPPVNETSGSAWKDTLAELNTETNKLLAAISRLTESELVRIVPGKEYSIYFLLHGVIQHNLYHAGQIAILKKGMMD